jgi:hypothetical protein
LLEDVENKENKVKWWSGERVEVEKGELHIYQLLKL